ncbi:hypothetical protein [Gramella sp. KN1008]|nr:hypothetical protein [Gramella sp. KN1008]
MINKTGESFPNKLKEEFPAREETLDNNEEVLLRLEKIEPGFIEWSKNFS